MIVGDHVKFVTEYGKWYTLIGEIERFGESFHTIRTLEGSHILSFSVPKTQILDVVDINRTGTPEEWIDDFRWNGSEYEECLIDIFTNGLCYTFADWLSHRLLFSKIKYVRERHHYVVEWNGNLYDITGQVTNKYLGFHLDDHKFEGDWGRFR